MKTPYRSTLLALCIVPMSASAFACAIPGKAIHWIADFCMLTLQTDDEIAASECINRELATSPENACVAKVAYKRKMCTLVVTRERKGRVDTCLRDPGFMGKTVRNGAVGS
jgi:hypothetical protein